ncbi:MAG: DotU family type IV/VI secretion system protein [Proteobacteria bacterium]|nr:DotU family type IV/VI secretion system protein [Pseudomonadota bacterium]
MLPSNLKNSFILKNFTQFFQQIVAEKTIALEGISISDTKNEKSHKDILYNFVATISKNISSLLEAQEFTVSHEGGDFLMAYYQEALYIMAALADEIFLNLNWVGQSVWDMFLIEQKIFKTQIAGDKFFENLDAYLLNRDPLKIDLGALYYFALALGFQGKYRGTDNQQILKNYMDNLFLFVVRKEPDFQTSTYLLFPEAYGYTLDEGLIHNLPNPRIWYGAFVGLVFGMGLIASILWYVDTSNTYQIIQKIMSQKSHHMKVS